MHQTGRVVVLSSVLLGFATFGFATIGYASNIPLIAVSTLSYFYYSVFTMWHEVAHLTYRYRHQNGAISALGDISISPLLIYDFESKAALHMRHHAYTNKRGKDPDYSANNLELKNSFNKPGEYKRRQVPGILRLTPILSKTFFIVCTYYWVIRYGSICYVCSLFLGYCFTHFLVNLYPHFRAGKGSRDLKGPPWLTLLLLGNNYHGSHHLNAERPWFSYLTKQQ